MHFDDAPDEADDDAMPPAMANRFSTLGSQGTNRFSLGVRGPWTERRGSMWRLWGQQVKQLDDGHRGVQRTTSPSQLPPVRSARIGAKRRQRTTHGTGEAPLRADGGDGAQAQGLGFARVRWARALVRSDPRRVIHEFFMPGDDRGPRGYLQALACSRVRACAPSTLPCGARATQLCAHDDDERGDG